MSSSDFKRVAAWGSKGKIAVAQCPEGYRVVAGGSSSSDGSFVGTGYANSKFDSWYVHPDSNASAEAFASCLPKVIARKYFRWRSCRIDQRSSRCSMPARIHAHYRVRIGYHHQRVV